MTVRAEIARRERRLTPDGLEFLAAGGWQVERGTAHRGVLTSDEWRWLNLDAVRVAIAHRLGFTHAEVHSVYRQGRKTAAQRELRARLDARLLEVSEAGGNMAALASALGFYVGANRSCQVITRALQRARATEGRT